MVDVPRHPEPSDAERLFTFLSRMTPGGAGGDSRAVGPVMSRTAARAVAVGSGADEDSLDAVEFHTEGWSITGTATSTFTLTFSPIEKSWNLKLNGAGVHRSEFTISGQTLTITTPSDLFLGAATQGSPWDLEIEYAYLAGVPTTPAEDPDYIISSNKAVPQDTTGSFAHLPAGVTVTDTQVDVVAASAGRDAGLIFSWVAANTFLTAQVTDTVVRILKSTGSGDTTLASTAFVPGTSFVLRAAMTSGGAITVYIDGVSKVTHTLSAGDLTTYGNPTTVGLRTATTVSGVTYDNLTVNGSLIDDFNRDNSSTLGISSVGNHLWVDAT